MHTLANARKHRIALLHLNMDSKHKPPLYDCQSRIRKLMNDKRQMFIHCSLIHFGSHDFLWDYISWRQQCCSGIFFNNMVECGILKWAWWKCNSFQAVALVIYAAARVPCERADNKTVSLFLSLHCHSCVKIIFLAHRTTRIQVKLKGY